jgi:hypothetical protein
MIATVADPPISTVRPNVTRSAGPLQRPVREITVAPAAATRPIPAIAASEFSNAGPE